VIPGNRNSLQDRAAEIDHATQHFTGSFQYEDLLSIDQSDNGVGRLLDELNEVGIYSERVVIESSELNHAGDSAGARPRRDSGPEYLIGGVCFVGYGEAAVTRITEVPVLSSEGN
jgi:hypothetical protein